jgi:hypothetical protein
MKRPTTPEEAAVSAAIVVWVVAHSVILAWPHKPPMSVCPGVIICHAAIDGSPGWCSPSSPMRTIKLCGGSWPSAVLSLRFSLHLSRARKA